MEYRKEKKKINYIIAHYLPNENNEEKVKILDM